MEEEQPIKLSYKDIDKLSKISDFLFKIYGNEEKKLFDDELLNTFYGGILVMTDEMEGTGMISIKYNKLIKEFSRTSI